jgi:hypothetical protein
MVLKSPSALKISLYPGSRGSRMSHMAALRRDFMSLYNHLESLLPTEPGELLAETGTAVVDLASLVRATPSWASLDLTKIPEDKIDRQRLPLLNLIRGELPAFIYCPRASDVLKAFELIDAHGFRATLVLGADAYRAAEILAAREDLGLVVLGPELEYLETDPETGDERRNLTARLLFDAGIRFALQSRTAGYRFLSNDGAYHLWYEAATLVRQGIPRSEAIRSVTVYPAKILGLDHRIGSLEKGKDANLAIFTGDFLDARSWVDRVFIEGKEVYNRREDRDLVELLRQKERGF